MVILLGGGQTIYPGHKMIIYGHSSGCSSVLPQGSLSVVSISATNSLAVGRKLRVSDVGLLTMTPGCSPTNGTCHTNSLLGTEHKNYSYCLTNRVQLCCGFVAWILSAAFFKSV